MTPLPPYAQLLRLSVEEGDEPRLRMPFDADVVGRPGYLHGGAIAGLLEFAAFDRLRRALGDDGVVAKPITVTVDYLRGGGEADTFASATIQRLGSRVASVQALAWQSDPDHPIASARINFLLERTAAQ